MKTQAAILRSMLPQPARTARPCWLALSFPHLALNLFTRGQKTRPLPLAVFETIRQREYVIDANPAALAAGVKPGIPLTAAHSIMDGLHALERNPHAEQQALQRLASWCYQYSHQVCVPGDRNGLFVEVGASEKLFGSPQQIAERLARELGQLGYHVMTGSATTHEAAWLAAPEGMHLGANGHIRQQLSALSLQQLFLQTRQVDSMRSMGFRQLRDLLRLPRKALTRRFGPGLPDYLDRLLGVRPDPRPLYEPPAHYSAQLELPAEIHSAQALLFPFKRMLDELSGVLRGGDHAVQGLSIRLQHEDAEDTVIELGLQSPSQDSSRLHRVLRERIDRLRLPAPVRGLILQAPDLLRFSADQHTLFQDTPGEQQQEVEQLAERIQARLGRNAISGLSGCEDHRPEFSWRKRRLDEKPECAALAHRPTWLLPRPQRCHIENYRILAGPERIESGWWDGRDCRRDYYIVRDHRGSTLWAFHEYKPRRGWFLQGIFA